MGVSVKSRIHYILVRLICLVCFRVTAHIQHRLCKVTRKRPRTIWSLSHSLWLAGSQPLEKMRDYSPRSVPVRPQYLLIWMSCCSRGVAFLQRPFKLIRWILGHANVGSDKLVDKLKEQNGLLTDVIAISYGTISLISGPKFRNQVRSSLYKKIDPVRTVPTIAWNCELDPSVSVMR